MQEKLNSIVEEINALQPANAEELENFRLKYLSRKGLLTDLFEEFKTVPNEQKREVGKKLNEVKTAAETKFNELKEKLENSTAQSTVDFDLTAPGEPGEPLAPDGGRVGGTPAAGGPPCTPSGATGCTVAGFAGAA